jgi:hypothetical protein
MFPTDKFGFWISEIAKSSGRDHQSDPAFYSEPLFGPFMDRN